MWNTLPLCKSINAFSDFPGLSTCHNLIKNSVYRDISAISNTFYKLMLHFDISLLSVISINAFFYQNYLFNMIYHIDFT